MDRQYWCGSGLGIAVKPYLRNIHKETGLLGHPRNSSTTTALTINSIRQCSVFISFWSVSLWWRAYLLSPPSSVMPATAIKNSLP
jgi:hypothetical protein